MKKYLVQCDRCTNLVHMKYNGEHWLAPEGWVELYDDLNAKMLDKHLCPTCNPVVKPQPTPKGEHE